MAYLNYNQFLGGHRQGPMVCFPVQNQQGGESQGNQGGIQGELTMPDGSQQSVVCYASLPPSGGPDQNGNSQGEPGSQGQQNGGEGQGGNQGQPQGEQGGMLPTPQDILEQIGQVGDQGQPQEDQGGMPTPQDILEQIGQGGDQGQPQGEQGGMPPTPQELLGQIGQGGNEGQWQGNQGGMPMPPGMFGPGGDQGRHGWCGHPQVIMPHCMWIPIRNGYYW